MVALKRISAQQTLRSCSFFLLCGITASLCESFFFVIVLIDALTVKDYKDLFFYAGTQYQLQGVTGRCWQTKDLRYKTVDVPTGAPPTPTPTPPPCRLVSATTAGVEVMS